VTSRGRDLGLVLAAPGEAPRLEEVELDPPGPGEVRVRMTAAGVCHSDLHIVETGGWGLRFPILLGHEAAAVVEELGEGVESVAPGDAVVLAWRSPCGRCPPCERGDPRRCRSPLRARRRSRRVADGELLTPALLVGAFATRTTVHERQAVKVPAELPPEQACLIGCAVATGVGAVLATASVWPGARVAVIGCGGVGLAAIQGARLAGASEIVAADVSPAKLGHARRFGATRALERLPDDLRVDFSFDAVGRPETLVQAVEALDHAGVATLIGIPRPGERASLDAQRLFDARGQLRVSHGGDHLPEEDFPRLARLALEGGLDLAGMVSRTITLDDAAGAVAEVGSGDAVRTVVRVEADGAT
jgi:S-(hydroxymethyl)mycothiol dehydrogenase